MSPGKIFKFLAYTLTFLGFLAWIFPGNGLSIGPVTLRFPELSVILKPEKQKYTDITSLIDSIQVDSTLTSKIVSGTKKDSINPADLAKLRKNLHRIQFPSDNQELLNPLFREFMSLKESGNKVRVLHYGDSQVEGDRITSFLRQQLQKTFGGYGPGIISIIEPTNTAAVERNQSENWKRYTIFGKRNPEIKHNRYGVMGSIARFESPDDVDTVQQTAWIDLKRSKNATPETQNFTSIKVLYGNVEYPVTLSISDEAKNVFSETTLDPVASSGQADFSFESNPAYLRINLSGVQSPDFYGIVLNGKSGISVDNIPQRGSSGTEFIKMDKDLLSQLYRDLNVKLLILEYGVNVAPYVTESYYFYEEQFYNNLVFLKSIDPDLRIIVISISDMAAKNGEAYETMPNIEKIRDAQKNAAFRAGCAFWDLYEAMGGRNSMPSWVFADPPLAGKDFTHFTWNGSRLIAEMFYQALIYEYYSFLHQSASLEVGSPETSSTHRTH